MSYFESLELLPSDPVLGIERLYIKDARPQKVNLGVGTYKDSLGKSLVLTSVVKAEQEILKKREDKDYLPIEGPEDFIQPTLKLILGEAHNSFPVFGAQTVGGTAALRVGAELLRKRGNRTVYLSTPTWPNHFSIFKAAGFDTGQYRYYSPELKSLDFPSLMEDIEKMPQESIILLQVCGHNPTGVDPSKEQWTILLNAIKEKKIFPFFDLSYQGWVQNLDEDAFPIRVFANQGCEFLAAFSYAKNMGLYGERAGALVLASSESSALQKAASQAKGIIRAMYSNPPLHPARIVAEILSNPTLKKDWEEELANMRLRINEMREAFVSELMVACSHIDFRFIAKQKGLFSLLGLTPGQVEKLKTEHAIYLLSNGRVNVAGLNVENMRYVAQGINKVLQV